MMCSVIRRPVEGVCLVDRVQLLVSVPGHGDLEPRVARG